MYKKLMLILPVSLIFAATGYAKPNYKPGELIVELKSGGVLSSKFYRSSKIILTHSNSKYLLIKSAKTVPQMIKALKDNPDILKVSPNYIRKALITPDDSDFSDQWGLYNTGQLVDGLHKTKGIAGADIDAPDAWGITTGSSNVVVADIDSGIDYNHPDLKANVWVNPGEIPGNGIDDDGNGYIDDVYGIDTINSDSDPIDDYGHGTFTAGIIAAVSNNNLGVAGVCWYCKVMGIKALDSAGIGYDSTIIEAINYIVDMKKDHNVNIVAINASFGGYGNDSILKDAIKAAGDAGIVFVSASGNETNNNDTYPLFPASYNLPNIISAAASDSSDKLASFSNYGVSSVQLMAPGVNILSTYYDSSGDQYAFADGTSAAAPFVAGAVGLVSSEYPGKSPAEWVNKILSGSDHISLDKVSSGRLNLYGALTSKNASPAISSLSYTQNTQIAPYKLTFNVSAADSDGIKEYDWDFDSDGITDQVTHLPSTSYTYNNDGTYKATVRVVDNLGARSYKSATIVIKKSSSSSSGSSGGSSGSGSGGSSSSSGGSSGGGCTIGESNYIGFSFPLFLLLSTIYLIRKKALKKYKVFAIVDKMKKNRSP